MILANTVNNEVITLKGLGGGPGIGVGLSPSPIGVSGDPQEVATLLSDTPFGSWKNLIAGIRAVPDLPGAYSSIFLCPGRTDSPQLFTRGGQLITGGAAVGVEVGAGVVLFFDDTPAAEFEVELAGSLGGPAAGAAAFAITSLKAFAVLAGLDYISDATIGVGDIIYDVRSYPSNACIASAT